jgi:BirA family transcriptional regulator, biotin operon repressor / biotin---[acetyl-CoA-carboxylase] ligase
MKKSEKMTMPDGFYHRAYDVIDSTNSQAIRLASTGEKSGLWVTAKEQLSGRGRHGRDWISKPGNFYGSLLYHSGKDLPTSAQLSFVAALALFDTISELIGSNTKVECKWPNDILVNDKKISGILLESVSHGASSPDYMVIGMGINIADHPEAALYPTTCLNHETGRYIEWIVVFNHLVKNMKNWLDSWQGEGFEVIRTAWLKYCKGLGAEITVKQNDEEIRGQFIDLDQNGALMLQIDGKTKLIHSGDVFFKTKNTPIKDREE